MKIKLENTEWELTEEYKEGFEEEALKERYTDYFEPYDYIIGDWSYGKLRLKGFCKKENKLLNNINDFTKIDKYIKDNCAFDCKYFVLEKQSKTEK